MILLLSLACSQSPGDAADPGGPRGELGITLIAPVDGEGTYDGSLEVAWAVTGLELDPAGIGGPDIVGHGHVHVYVDDELFEESADGNARVTGLTEGPHTVLVRLAGNDHQELDARDSVAIDSALPTVSVVSPPDGTALVTSSTPLSIAVDGFTLSDAIGGEDVFGEGHFTIAIDGEVRDWGADPMQAVATGIPEGLHTITVELVRNDGRPLEPPIRAETTVDVLPGARGVYFDRSAFGVAFESATLPIALSTTAFTLVESDGTRSPVEGEGHMHLYMDGAWLDRTVVTAHVLQNVPPGPHLFEARLVTNDGFEMPVVDRLRVDIAADRPDAFITYPGDQWRMGTSFDLAFEAENFTLAPRNMGGENAPREGHAQVYVDGLLYEETGTGMVPVSGLTVATHVVRVQLVNNDRTPVSPPVYNEIEVIVEATTP